jgi:hypothetical protein
MDRATPSSPPPPRSARWRSACPEDARAWLRPFLEQLEDSATTSACSSPKRPPMLSPASGPEWLPRLEAA